jgi:hypothetical protein
MSPTQRRSGAVGGEVAAEQVSDGGGGQTGDGGLAATAQVDPDNAVLAHQPVDPLVVDHQALGAQLGAHPGRPVSATGLAVNSADLLEQPGVGGSAPSTLGVPASQA